MHPPRASAKISSLSCAFALHVARVASLSHVQLITDHLYTLIECAERLLTRCWRVCTRRARGAPFAMCMLGRQDCMNPPKTRATSDSARRMNTLHLHACLQPRTHPIDARTRGQTGALALAAATAYTRGGGSGRNKSFTRTTSQNSTVYYSSPGSWASRRRRGGA